jgi:hypothetical protein
VDLSLVLRQNVLAYILRSTYLDMLISVKHTFDFDGSISLNQFSLLKKLPARNKAGVKSEQM